MELELHQLERRYETLRLFDRNVQARLTASLVAHGQRSPVLVVETDGRLVLIDGYQRVRALEHLGRDLVTSTKLELSESEALLLSHQLVGRRRSALEEAWLLRELIERHGMTQRRLALDLDRSASWVSRRLALLNDLPDEVEEALRAGKLSPQVAMKYLVPLARANVEHCRRLVAALDGEPISVRDMARLYAGWRSGTEQQRSYILGHPRQYLRLDAEVAPSKGEMPGETDEQKIVRKLSVLSSVCMQVRQLLRSRAPNNARTPLAMVVRYAFAEAQASFQSLAALLMEEATDA